MATVLDRINDPGQLREMTNEELDVLAAELRQRIVETVASRGGHLASNLGVVELTLALHAVFRSPEDKIIWDVGHQCYTHKILTGRSQAFDTLRSFGGLSGFPKREESPHDIFNTGHAGTSISAALGIAMARDQKQEDFEVIAVIGDGSLTSGMAYEALNYAGDLRRDLVVVLNDNKMSIQRNVGAMASYLGRLRTDPMYFRGKEEVENLIKRLPHGSKVLRLAERLKDSLKYLVVPGMLFEELGFTYLGPIDGHDIAAMKSVFSRAKSLKGPVLVHVLTEKGKGYSPAEDKPDTFHGIGPFDIGTGTAPTKGGPPSYTSVFARTITELAGERENLVAITAAMPGGTGLDMFAGEYPDRFFDVGIAEQSAVTMAAGMAAGGLKPVVAIYSTFLQRAFDQVLHDVCMQKLPVVFALDRGGIVGEDGETHQGVFDLSYLRCIPNLVVMAPRDENELRRMLLTAVLHDGPVALRYPRGKGTGACLTPEITPVPVGQAEVLREGDDLCILAVGNQVQTALKASELLAELGPKAAVVDCRFVKPLDVECITGLAKKTGRVVTIEENVLAGGFGSAVLEMLEDGGLIGKIAVVRAGVPDVFIEHGSQELLREKFGLSAEKIVEKVRRTFPELF